MQHPYHERGTGEVARGGDEIEIKVSGFELGERFQHFFRTALHDDTIKGTV